MEKIFSEELRIERLQSDHDREGFSSYEKELVKFLQEDALQNQEKRISVTYLCFKKITNELLGYITLLNDKINLQGDLELYFKDKGILYKSLPALKIGRLAVDDKFLKRGIGTALIAFAIKVADAIFQKHSGCRFLTLDAKRNKEKTKDSLDFYKKLGFCVFKESKETTPMYLDLSSLPQTSSDVPS